MIRINLLPFRAARKRENVRRQVSVYFLCLVFLIVLVGYMTINLSGQLDRLETQRESLRKERKSYDKVRREIAQLKRDTKDLNTKLGVIEKLEQQRVGPVLLLTDIAHAVPLDRLWLDGLSEGAGKTTLWGTAMDNHTVALFMTALEKAPQIKSVDLDRTTLKYFPQYKQRAKSFVLTCLAANTENAADPKQGKGVQKDGKRR